MKQILEFESPDDDEAFRAAIDGWKWKSLIEEFDNWMRSEQKYSEVKKTLDDCREKLYQLANDENLILFQ